MNNIQDFSKMTASTKTTDFCDANQIEWFGINLTINGAKKDLNPINHKTYNNSRPNLHDFSNIDLIRARQHLFKSQPDLFTHLCINTKNVYHIDLDTPEYDVGFDNIAYNTPYFKSMTKSYGKHILIKSDKSFIPQSARMQFKNSGNGGVELLCGGGSYAPFEMMNAEKPIMMISSNDLKNGLICRSSSPVSVVNIHSNVSIQNIETDIYYKYLNCIGNKMCDRGMYDDTIKVLQILKNENLDIKYVKYWIQRFAYPDSKKYTYAIDYYDENKKAYIKFTPLNVEKRLTIKSLKYFAKINNPQLYSTYFSDDYEFMITKKYPTIESLPAKDANNEADFSNLYYEFRKERIHYKNDNIYLYYNDEWNITSDKGRMVKNDMYEFYIIYLKVWMDYINEYEKKHIEDNDMEKEKKIKTMRGDLNCVKVNYSKNSVLSNTYALLLNKLSCVKCSIEFDVGSDNYYNIHFKNGVYDLKKGFRSRLESDYITKYLDYDYIPLCDISKEVQNDVLNFFKKVQPNKEQRDFTLGYLAYCLTGDATKQIFKMNIGYTASNGKSTELSIHEKCFKIYTKKMDNRVLLTNFANRHKHLIDLVSEPIRLTYFEEMPKGKKLDVDFIKDFVDGKNITCEIMHGTKAEIKIQSKIMSVGNHDFQLDTDAGILRRGRVQKYNSKFISKDDGKIDEDNHIYEKIDGFENRFDNIVYKNAYFQLLLNYIDKLVVPKINKDEFKKTAEENDNILTDILDGFIITKNETDYISKSEFDTLCGSNKDKFNEYKSKLLSMGCKYESQERHHSSVRGRFSGIKKIEIIIENGI